jgi:hypothetical protein
MVGVGIEPRRNDCVDPKPCQEGDIAIAGWPIAEHVDEFGRVLGKIPIVEIAQATDEELRAIAFVKEARTLVELEQFVFNV